VQPLIAVAEPGIVFLSAARPALGGVVPREALLERLAHAARVTVISAPAGSGKTFLLRSWISQAGLLDRVAWVSVSHSGSDAQQFWLRVLEGLCATSPGSASVRTLTAAPDFDGLALVERLLEDLSAFETRVWLVIDDLHELESSEVLSQLELLLMRAPSDLRFVLATRHDVRLGLHRLRLEGGVTEIRAVDLRFTVEEARELFESAGVTLTDSALKVLVERTEGWAAGLRLAALSLSGHPDPDRFAAEFSGSERTVAEYLLAEVLERQPDNVKELLLRTSILDRVNGELADLLSGGRDGERTLQDLEEANAFVSSLDARRAWFRYHRLFADLLHLELRRTASDQIPVLHRLAADWFAEHDLPVEAVRHAQAGRDWGLAARLLSDSWVSLLLNGQTAAGKRLIAAFPAGALPGDADLVALRAADELAGGSLDEAERHVTIATRALGSAPAQRRAHLRMILAAMRLSIARRRGDLNAVVEEAQALLSPAESAEPNEMGPSQDLRAAALITLGITNLWTMRYEEANRNLDEGIVLTHRIHRPYYEIIALAHRAIIEGFESVAISMKRSLEAVELARRHGWAEEPAVAMAYINLAAKTTWLARFDEAEKWLVRAERPVRAEGSPGTAMMLHRFRGMLALARGHDADALHAFQGAERLAKMTVTGHPLATWMRACCLLALVRLGRVAHVEQSLAVMDAQEHSTAVMRVAEAVLRLAQNEPEAATDALQPVLDPSAWPAILDGWIITAFLLAAIAHDRLRDLAEAERALERALDLAEPDGMLLPFVLHPAPELLERHRGVRTGHAALISDVLSLVAGNRRVLPDALAKPLSEPVTDSEMRVLRYLPTNLSQREIAGELYISVHTVRSHIKHLYAKFDAHGRAEAVERGRALGLLAPSRR
jgi:LuxR family maltose regulon positive regulatory protein